MLTFSNLLALADLPPASVRLLRHQDTRYKGSASPYALWRDDRDRFNAYQQTQAPKAAAMLRAPYWASFVGLPDKETLFVGIYAAHRLGPTTVDRIHPMTSEVEAAGSIDSYELGLLPALDDYIGRVLIDWGKGYRSWIQRAMVRPSRS